MKEKIKWFLARKAYLIVHYGFAIGFFVIVILHYVIYEQLPLVFKYILCFITGIFIGFNIAYYAIKYIQTNINSKNNKE